jgi:hypothetical protein
MQREPDRNEQLGEFFAAHAGRITAARELIEDACASALAIMVRRDDITLDQRGFSWLTTVVVRTIGKAWQPGPH